MNAPNLRTRALIIAGLFALAVVAVSVYVSFSIEKSKDNIIEQNSEISLAALEQFASDIRPVLKDVWYNELRGRDAITRRDERIADSLLSGVTEEILARYEGIEGGIYFLYLDEFIGYAYPSIPSPKPAFGPPPRSYEIIRGQARQSILENKTIMELHGFDPAVFPLATTPVDVDGELVAALWTRVHIGRELAGAGDVTSVLIYMTLIVTLLGFIIALTISWNLKINLEEIRAGLDKVKSDNTYRLPERKGLPGFISHYINDLISNLFHEQKKRAKLERELHQKEKMATLGKMIAGAAHEINTPISIIKTRIQIWERNLKRPNSGNGLNIISAQSLKEVRHEIDRVSELVKRLLIFSKPVASRKKPVNILDILKKSIPFVTSSFNKKDVSIHLDCPQTEFILNGDERSLEQVFTNIFKNSVEAATDKAIISITCAYLKMNHSIKIEVADNGTGIPDEIKNNVFDPFYTTKNEGTGLGLSIAYEIMRAHNGTIEFVNSSASGTTCVITLPLAEESKPEAGYAKV